MSSCHFVSYCVFRFLNPYSNHDVGPFQQYPHYTVLMFDDWSNNLRVVFFVISRTREQDLYLVLMVPHHSVQSINFDWNPFSINTNNAHAKINMLK